MVEAGGQRERVEKDTGVLIGTFHRCSDAKRGDLRSRSPNTVFPRASDTAEGSGLGFA